MFLASVGHQNQCPFVSQCLQNQSLFRVYKKDRASMHHPVRWNQPNGCFSTVAFRSTTWCLYGFLNCYALCNLNLPALQCLHSSPCKPSSHHRRLPTVNRVWSPTPWLPTFSRHHWPLSLVSSPSSMQHIGHFVILLPLRRTRIHTPIVSISHPYTPPSAIWLLSVPIHPY